MPQIGNSLAKWQSRSTIDMGSLNQMELKGVSVFHLNVKVQKRSLLRWPRGTTNQLSMLFIYFKTIYVYYVNLMGNRLVCNDQTRHLLDISFMCHSKQLDVVKTKQ